MHVVKKVNAETIKEIEVCKETVDLRSDVCQVLVVVLPTRTGLVFGDVVINWSIEEYQEIPSYQIIHLKNPILFGLRGDDDDLYREKVKKFSIKYLLFFDE